MDSRTRPDHVEADGQIRELEDPFVVGGSKRMGPHQFGVAHEDINCRCVALKRARAALEMSEEAAYTKWDGENQCHIDLSDARSYGEFKERYDDVVAQSRRASENSVTPWSNEAVSSLADNDAARTYLSEHHGITAMESFSKLPLETQKSAVAGIDAAVGRYGGGDAQHVRLIAGSSRDDGQYDAMAGTILLNRNVKDAYIVAYHETM